MKIQQGDVILRETNIDLKKGKKLNHLVLAEGEVTGHRHEITSGIAQLIVLKNSMFLKVISDYAKLKHAEHDFRETIRNYGGYNNIPENFLEYMKINNLLPLPLENFNEFVERIPREIIVRNGTWEIGRVNERDHFEEETRRVTD